MQCRMLVCVSYVVLGVEAYNGMTMEGLDGCCVTLRDWSSGVN